ncbi:MAG: hypothetical protein R3288_04740 [Woeseiaceae bacterium]|nr:hypothetical protein [Woeseiaceae bacterium]
MAAVNRHAVAMLVSLALTAAVPPAIAATSLWWDTNYEFRINVDVRTGANVPDKGYNGYTARIAALDTLSLIAAGDMQSDCSDLRVLFFDGLAWQELPRHVLNCNNVATDVRFMLAADIPANAGDDNYYVYHGNPAPAALPAMTPTNVYLWYDDATIDRSGSYVRGRIDNWHGNGWDNSLAWNPGGFYTYTNGDNFTSGYRRAIDERDVYVEAEFFHIGCFPFNITTGVLVRGIILGGTLGSETSNHYYASNRGQYPGCNATGYSHDGDIVKNQRPNVAINGPNPPAIVPNVWRRQGLAAWLTSPTNLAFWDEDLSLNWAAPGFPSNANLQVSGSDASDNPGRGFAAVMTAQDDARVRNILMRRYIDPEPAAVLTPETQPPNLLLQKTLQTAFDPVNNTVNPKAIPGSWVDYTITAFNSGAGAVDPDTVTVTDPLPANVVLFVGDLAGPGSGPVEFVDGTGAAASGLSYSYGGLGDPGDDLEFSTDGTDWSYVPTPDADGFDAAVRYVRVRPGGTFGGTTGGPPTTFDLRFRVRVQ